MLLIAPAQMPMYTRGRTTILTEWLMANTDNSVIAPDTLIVSWHWPPVNRASTGVLANLFRDAPAECFRVITRDMPRLREEDRTTVPPFETHRVAWRPAEEREGTLSTWTAGIRAALRMVRTARRLYQARPFERVIAVYPHRFGLLAGWWIARRQDVPLVAYMHDLFAEAYLTGSRLKRTFWRWLDRRALSDAALVVTPTDEFAAHYGKRGIDRTLVLPHCTPVDVTASPLPEPRRVLRLVYTGNLYDAHEDSARAFLTASDSLRDIHLTLLTPPHPMLGGRSSRWAPRDQAIEAMRQADVCVLVLSHNAPYAEEIQGCFPSKIVDYLAVARPILAIVPPGCFADRFLRETGAGVVVNSLEPKDIRTAIDSLRDTELRERLADAAARVACRLRAKLHLPRLLRGLTEPERDKNPVNQKACVTA